MKTYPISFFDGEYWFYSSKEGEILAYPKCKYIGLFIGKYSIFEIEENESIRAGIIDYTGKIIINPIFEWIEGDLFEVGIFIGEIKIGISKYFKVIINLRYEEIKYINVDFVSYISSAGFISYNNFKNKVYVHNGKCKIVLEQPYKLIKIHGTPSLGLKTNITYFHYEFSEGYIKDLNIYLVYGGGEIQEKGIDEEFIDYSLSYYVRIFDKKGKFIKDVSSYYDVKNLLQILKSVNNRRPLWHFALKNIISSGYSIGITNDKPSHPKYEYGNFLFKREKLFFTNVSEEQIIFINEGIMKLFNRK